MANITRLRAVSRSCVRTALSLVILAIYHKPRRYLIAIINWLPM